VILNPTNRGVIRSHSRLQFDRSALDLRRSFYLPVLTIGLVSL
jgi:hypothetical protein